MIQWLAITLLVGLVHPSGAFFPTQFREDVIGNNGVSHVEQTDQAFQSVVSKYFPTITDLSKTMIAARDTITKANADVDNDQTHSALHFDGENFDGGQARLHELREEVIANLIAADGDGAQKALGGALHTVQDFYSHSNYVEMGFSLPSSLLGRNATITFAGPNDRTCVDCIKEPWYKGGALACPDCTSNVDGFTSQLTSGYYFGEDSPVNGAPISDFKCHHGGKIDNSKGAVFGFAFGEPSQGINKDSLSCKFSPHYWAHLTAVDLAVAATVQYIEDIAVELDSTQLALLFGVTDVLSSKDHIASFVNKADSERTITTLRSLTTTHQNLILQASGSASSIDTYIIPVDSTMTELSISLQITDALSPPASINAAFTLSLTDPSGSSVSFTDPSITYTTLLDGIFLALQAPHIGSWTISIATSTSASDSASYDLQASTLSPLILSSFDFVALTGRPGHQGYYPISTSSTGKAHLPNDIAATAVIDGPFSGPVTFSLHQSTGTNSATYPLDLSPGSGALGEPPTNAFFGKVTQRQLRDSSGSSAEEFYSSSMFVYATGTDTQGNPFQRVWSGPMVSSPVEAFAVSSNGKEDNSVDVSAAAVANSTASGNGIGSTSTSASVFSTTLPTTSSSSSSENSAASVGIYDTVDAVGTAWLAAAVFALGFFFL